MAGKVYPRGKVTVLGISFHVEGEIGDREMAIMI